MNYNDIHAYWMNPDNTSRRKQKITDVAAVLIDSSYKDGDEMTVDDHRKWGVAPLSQKHLDYAAKNAFLSYELYRMLDFYERGFFRRLYKKPVSPDLCRWLCISKCQEQFSHALWHTTAEIAYMR